MCERNILSRQIDWRPKKDLHGRKKNRLSYQNYKIYLEEGTEMREY